MNSALVLFEVDMRMISSSKLNLDLCRIDPQFYSVNQNFMDGLVTKQLSFFCEELFNPPVFKREFLNDKNECRYLASGEIVSSEPEVNYISNIQADSLRLRVKNNWILVMGFGTIIGSIRFVDTTIDGFAVGNNVTRIIPKKNLGGFIAAFLQSSFGHKMLNDYASGAVIKYIEAPQISKIPVPVLADKIIEEINYLYISAVSCREKASLQLSIAHQLILNYNNLPELSDLNFDLIDSSTDIEIFLTNLSEFTVDHRLDAHFYNQLAKRAETNIKRNCASYKKLIDVTREIRMSPLFVRNFVENDFGIKYIAGKNISQIRKSFKYISKTETEGLEEHTLRKRWTLMTCAGTIGKTGYVNDELDGATAQDLMRIVADENKIDSGYMNCWLSTLYGKALSMRQRYGAVVDRISPEQTGEILIPIPSDKQQKEIGDLVRQAYDLRAEAIRLEDEAPSPLIRKAAHLSHRSPWMKAHR